MKKLLFIALIGLTSCANLPLQKAVKEEIYCLSEYKDTTFIMDFRYENRIYKYKVEQTKHQTFVTELDKKKLYTDWKKIGGVSLFFIAWGALLFAV